MPTSNADGTEHDGVPRVRLGPIPWLDDSLRASVETAVSKHCSREWRIVEERDYSEFACHRAAIVSDGSLAVFFKLAEGPDARPQFQSELSGLRTLSRAAGVLAPNPIDIVAVEAGALLLMEAIGAVSRGPRQWREMGAALARIHGVKADRFGLDRDGFWGPFRQENTPTADWVEFFRERRLVPILRAAVDSGNLPPSVAAHVERLVPRLGELCGPDVSPALLHGDAQQNNFVSAAEGAYVIDPAVHYGNPEFDLAMVESWQPVPAEFFAGYRQTAPIARGFSGRRDLWRLPCYLGAVAHEGSAHLGRLTDALDSYR